MQTGVLSSDNIAQVLRGIAQKRKQGTLEVNNGDQILQIQFIAGKIVDAYESLQSAENEIITKIGAAGVLPEGFSFKGSGYSELFFELEAAGCVLDLDEFQVVIHQRILGQLYSLNLNTGAYYSFKIQMIENEEEYTPTISVGQLLLDLVAIEDDKDSFQELFPADHVIRLQEDIEGEGIEEGFVIHAMGSHQYPAEIEAACMLSAFHYREVLTNFLNRGSILVELEREEAEVDSEVRPLDDIVAALEGGIDTDIAELDLDKIVAEAAMERVEVPQVTKGRVAEEAAGTNVEELAPFRVSFFSVGNAKLLQAQWVPGVIVLLFMLGALFAPLLSWGNCFEAFSKF